MLYEFAITPDVFDGSRIQHAAEPKVILWMLQGLEQNGLIANLHGKQWEIHTAKRLLQNCPPNVRDKVQILLRVLKDRKRLIPYPQRLVTPPADDIEWLDLSLDEHHRQPFRAIVLSHDLLEICTPNEQACIDLDELLESSPWTDRPSSVPVTKNEAGYRAHLASLLRHTRMLRIVDPYMVSYKATCVKTLSLCAELLGEGSHENVQRRIQVHVDPTKDNRTPADQLLAWETKLKPIAARYGHEIEIFLWSTRVLEHRFHDRFLLIDQCGIGSQDSFECVAGGASTTRWFLLQADERERQNAELRPATTHYNHGGSQLITP